MAKVQNSCLSIIIPGGKETADMRELCLGSLVAWAVYSDGRMRSMVGLRNHLCRSRTCMLLLDRPPRTSVLAGCRTSVLSS